jgi:two-component system sensor histidine kinase VanS
MTSSGTAPARAASVRGLMRWRPRLTFRTRLTLTFTVLVAIAGVLMVGIVTVFMRTVPTYAGPEARTVEAHTSDGALVTGLVPEAGSSTPQRAASITLRSADDILDTTVIVSLLVLLALVVCGAVVSWLVAGRILRPLQAVNHAAKAAGAGAFDHRVGLRGPQDELKELSDTFDDMLERLDRSFAASQRFAANASHELRTPLAATQTMLEVALSDPHADRDELREVARRVLETNRRNIETVEALLDLSEIEQGGAAREPVSLGSLVREAVRESAAEADARALTVAAEVDEALTVRGDTVLLRQAVGNLVRNAVRHNVDGGRVDISARADADDVRLRVENTGRLLPEGIVGSLTEPFVRAAGRTAGATMRGHGLGLAIVASVARAVGGSVELRARDGGGLVAELVLPASPGSRKG